VMYCSKPISLAIEGKWKEGRYQTVCQWRTQGNIENRQRVLKHWKGCVVPRSSGIGCIDNVVYQMLHRTASACTQESDKVVVVYQVFHDSSPKGVEYGKDLKTLTEAISSKGNLEIWLQDIRIDKTELYDDLEEETKRIHGSQDSVKRKASIVREAISSGELFHFEIRRLRRFGYK